MLGEHSSTRTSEPPAPYPNHCPLSAVGVAFSQGGSECAGFLRMEQLLVYIKDDRFVFYCQRNKLPHLSGVTQRKFILL